MANDPTRRLFELTDQKVKECKSQWETNLINPLKDAVSLAQAEFERTHQAALAQFNRRKMLTFLIVGAVLLLPLSFKILPTLFTVLIRTGLTFALAHGQSQHKLDGDPSVDSDNDAAKALAEQVLWDWDFQMQLPLSSKRLGPGRAGYGIWNATVRHLESELRELMQQLQRGLSFASFVDNWVADAAVHLAINSDSLLHKLKDKDDISDLEFIFWCEYIQTSPYCRFAPETKAEREDVNSWSYQIELTMWAAWILSRASQWRLTEKCFWHGADVVDPDGIDDFLDKAGKAADPLVFIRDREYDVIHVQTPKKIIKRLDELHTKLRGPHPAAAGSWDEHFFGEDPSGAFNWVQTASEELGLIRWAYDFLRSGERRSGIDLFLDVAFQAR